MTLFDASPDEVTANTLGAVMASDPETSHQAAEFVFRHTGSQKARVLIALAQSVAGLTDYEASLVAGIKRPHAAGTRRKALADMGFVQATDRKRPTDSGCDAIVWEVTPAGREVAARLLAGDPR